GHYWCADLLGTRRYQEQISQGAGAAGARMIPARLLSIIPVGIGAVVLGMAWTASAQVQDAEHAPDRARGAVIAAQGTAAGAPACAQCHAFNGVADGSGAFPRIAGQSAHYLAKQLQYFASGIRDNA